MAFDQRVISEKLSYISFMGRARKIFAQKFLQRKAELTKEIMDELSARVKSNKQEITCRKGCFPCCAQHINITVAEADAIVFWLYTHRDVLDHFLKQYPIWRNELDQMMPIVDGLNISLNQGDWARYNELLNEYLKKNLLCPFLKDGACSIYEARPYACASVLVSSPAEYCRGDTTTNPTVYFPEQAAVDKLMLENVPRRYLDSTQANLRHFPMAVFGLLQGGWEYLEKIPGLEDSCRMYFQDDEVTRAYKKIGQSMVP